MNCDCINGGCTVHLDKQGHKVKAVVRIVLADNGRTDWRVMCAKCAVDYAQLGRITILEWL